MSTEPQPCLEMLPVYQRLCDEGAMYRRRMAVPPEAAFVHRILAPIAEDLNGRVHDDDGRRVGGAWGGPGVYSHSGRSLSQRAEERLPVHLHLVRAHPLHLLE